MVDREASPPTITTEFDLYCDRAWMKGLLGTSTFLVGTLATMIFG